MYSATTRYQPVSVRAVRKGSCPGCGRSVARQRTFEMTISPFDKNSDGTVRTPAEVWKACAAEAKAWQPEPDSELFYHEKCTTERTT